MPCHPYAATAAKSLQSCPTLCDPRNGSLPGSPVPGILQARTLEGVAISFSNAWKWKVKVKSLSRVWLLVTPWTCSLLGSSVYGIFQARVLEWVAIAFSKEILPRYKEMRFCSNIDGRAGYYARWSKSERHILYAITYMWTLKDTTNQWI